MEGEKGRGSRGREGEKETENRGIAEERWEGIGDGKVRRESQTGTGRQKGWHLKSRSITCQIKSYTWIDSKNQIIKVS